MQWAPLASRFILTGITWRLVHSIEAQNTWRTKISQSRMKKETKAILEKVEFHKLGGENLTVFNKNQRGPGLPRTRF